MKCREKKGEKQFRIVPCVTRFDVETIAAGIQNKKAIKLY